MLYMCVHVNSGGDCGPVHKNAPVVRRCLRCLVGLCCTLMVNIFSLTLTWERPPYRLLLMSTCARVWPLNRDPLLTLHPSFLRTPWKSPSLLLTPPFQQEAVYGCNDARATCCPSVSVLSSPLSTNQKLLMLMKGTPLLALPDMLAVCARQQQQRGGRLPLSTSLPALCCLSSQWRGPRSNPRTRQTQKKASTRTQA